MILFEGLRKFYSLVNLRRNEMSNGQGTKRRCAVCGYRIRGSNHEEGKHHKDAGKVKK